MPAVEQLLLSYRLNLEVPRDSSVVSVTRSLVAVLHVKIQAVTARCLKVTGLVLVVGERSTSYRLNQGTLLTSSV